MSKKRNKIKVDSNATLTVPETRNFVAKWMNEFNRSATMIDRKKEMRKGSARKCKHKGTDLGHGQS